MAIKVSRQELKQTIWIGGPALEGDEGWLWLTRLELINGDPDSKTYVTSDHEVTDVSFGLRVLQQEPDSTEVELAQTIDGKENEIHELKAPRLLWSAYQASATSSEAYFEVKSRDIRVPAGEDVKQSYRDFKSPLGVNNVEHQGLLIPAENWPNQPKHRRDGGLIIKKWNYARFRMPPFRLVEGQIDASVYHAEGQQTIGKRLQIDFNNHTLLGAAKFDPADGGFPCAFVPTGIEFNLKLPNPLSAFLESPTDELKLFVRLTGAATDEGFKWHLQLVDGDAAHLAELNEGITNALSSLRDGENAPLSIEYNNTNRVPRIRWNLEQDDNQRLSIREDIELDRTTTRVTLLSGEASKNDRRGVAFLPDAKLILSGRANPRLMIESGSDVSGSMRVKQTISSQWRRPTDNDWTLDPPNFKLLAEPDIEGLEDQLTSVYEASGVWQEGRAPYGFLAVNEGLVQLPIPSEEDFPQGGAESEDTFVPSANGFVGEVVLVTSSDGPERYVQIDSAGYIKLDAKWDGSKFASVRLEARLPNGALHGYVWSVNSSPDADDVLPVPRAGGIATSDIPQYFSATGESRCYPTRWVQTYDAGTESGQWKATLTDKKGYRPTAWIRHRKLPAIPTVNTNRVSTSSVNPSETRALIPLEIAGSTESDDLFVLSGGLDCGLPELSLFEAPAPLTGNTPWPPGDASEPLIPLFMPTLPDVEFTPRVHETYGYEGIDEFRLSYSLAALDELFANASLPTPSKTIMPLATSDEFVVADQSARLALTVQVGDVAIQTDVSKTYILQTPPATVNANWKEVPTASTSVITALTLDELKQTWTDKFNKLDLTKTQGQYVFGWKAWESTPVTVAVDNLLEPFTWKVDIELGEKNEEALPFGKYVLDGIAFDGEKVVGGLGSNQTAYFEIDGATLVRKDSAQDNTVPVVGWAASTYVEAADAANPTAPFQQLVVDHLGWKQQRYLEEVERYHEKIDGRLLIRAVGFASKTPKLVTFKAAQDWGHGLVFWCRDLPMTKGGESWLFASSDNALEGAINPNDLTRIREYLPETVHEWRLFNKPNSASNAGAFYVQFGVVQFRPLRLIKLSLHDTDPSQDSLQVLGSVSVAMTATNASDQSYAGENPYQTGNLTLLTMNRDGEPVLESKVLKEVGSEFELKPNSDGIQQQYSARVFSEVRPGGTKVPRDEQSPQIISLQFKFAPGSANLGAVTVSARLFGEIRTIEIEGGPSGPTPDDPSLKFEARFGTPLEFSGWLVTRVCLAINLNNGYADLDFDASTTVENEHSLPIAKIDIREGDANISWLNCTIKNRAHISIDHQRGTLDAVISDASSTDPLIANMFTPAIEVDLHISLVFAAADDGTRQSGQLSGVARQQGSHGDRFSDFVATQTFVFDSRESERDQPVLVSLKMPERTSGVNWPVATTDIAKRDDSSSVVRMSESESAELTHHVATSLNEHQLSLSLLDWEGDRVYLQQPWKVLALVEHRLNWNNHPELDPDAKLDQHYKTIDNLTIRPVSTNSKSGDSDDLPAVFAARYWAGDYRDQEEETSFGERTRKYMLHPSLARAEYGHSGFNDGYISDALLDTADDELLVFGASHLFLAWDEEGNSSFLSLPYVAALSSAVLPAPFDKIQSPVGTSDWTASNIDSDLSKGNIRLTTNAPTVFASTSQRQAAIVARFKSSMSVPSEVSLPDLVDQAIVTPAGGAENAVTDCPLFLRSLLALKEVNKDLNEKTAAPRKVFVHALSQNQSGVVVGQIETQKSDRATPQFRTSVVAIGFQGTTRVEITLPSSGSAETTFNLGEKVSREAVTAVLSRASVILIAVKREDLLNSFVTYPQVRAVRVRGSIRNPTSRIKTDLRDPQQIIYASPAYGWPEADSIPRATRQGVLGGDDAPFQSTQAGFAGRTAVFGTLPAALPPDDQPVYMFTSVRTVFERPEERSAAVAADHLIVPTRRMRVPKASAVEDAAVPLISPNEMAPITPSYVERARLGDRPGILQHSIDGFLVAGPASSAERLHGDPGTIGPASVRQVRSTRSPALPRLKGAEADADQVFQKSRRTYVSKLDHENDEFVSVKWSRGGLAMVRHEFEFNKADTRTFFVVSEANATISADWKGRLNLKIDSEFGSEFGDELSERLPHLNYLAHLGILKKNPDLEEQVQLVAELVIDTESFRFTKLVLSPETNQRLILTFTGVEKYLRIQELLETATADTSMGFRLQPASVAKEQLKDVEVFTLDDQNRREVSLLTSVANKPEPGPPRMVYIPLMIKPVDRPSLPVRLSTVLFGDPSYDRMLSSNAAADAIIKDNKRWLLALDREAYDPTSTVYLAYGKLDQEELFTSGDNFDLTVQQMREGIETPFDLRLNDGDFDPIQSNTGYGINIGSLVYKNDDADHDNQPIDVQHGDLLVFSIPISEQRALRVRVKLVYQPVIAPPPCTYYFVRHLTDDDDYEHADVPLGDTSPLPQVIEFPNLVDDLARGRVRRSAQFVWYLRELATFKQEEGGLVKFDRSGGGQIPEKNDLQRPTK